MSHHTKDKGDLAVAKVLSHLLEHDIRACLPLSEHLPFDFIAVMPDMQTLVRVQVKYRKANSEGIVPVSFRANYYDSKKIYSKRVDLDRIDVYAVYTPDSDQILYLRVNEIPNNSVEIYLRIAPTKNAQSKNVRFAADYVSPIRIATCGKTVETIRRQRTTLDERATTKTIEIMMERGEYVCIPQSQYLPFDVVAISPDMKTLSRVVVSAAHINGNAAYADRVAVYDPYTLAITFHEREVSA
jgi:hypothetical protein